MVSRVRIYKKHIWVFVEAEQKLPNRYNPASSAHEATLPGSPEKSKEKWSHWPPLPKAYDSAPRSEMIVSGTLLASAYCIEAHESVDYYSLSSLIYHLCVHTYISIYNRVCIYIYIDVHRGAHTYLPTYLTTCLPAYLPTCLAIDLHTYIHTYIPTARQIIC